jgi:hypothetical protein
MASDGFWVLLTNAEHEAAYNSLIRGRPERAAAYRQIELRLHTAPPEQLLKYGVAAIRQRVDGRHEDLLVAAQLADDVSINLRGIQIVPRGGWNL